MSRYFGISLAASIIALQAPVHGDWLEDSTGGISAGDPQDVVISLKVNPLNNAEAACLAVTLARALKSNNVTNVTLFPTLDGVALGDGKIVRNPKFRCTTPFPEPQPVSLKNNLERFLADNPNNMVVCPICWAERYGDEMPDYGFLPPDGSPAVGKMILDAEKVVDF
jgi:hypothetical protein